MALEAVAYQIQNTDLLGQNNDHNIINNGNFDSLYPLLLENWASSSSSFDYPLENNQSSSEIIDDWRHNYAISGINSTHFWDTCNYCDYGYPTSVDAATLDECQQWPPNLYSSSPEMEENGGDPAAEVERPKRRRRPRTKKNKEEIENQRMTHIAVERNRRKQMNDYLSVLRSLMPDSYVQRGDQASIIGGAINFVKELEQNLQCLSAKKHINENSTSNSRGSVSASASASSLPFGEFFAFPQYSGASSPDGSGGGASGFSSGTDNDDQVMKSAMRHHLSGGRVAADVEVTMVERHALLKIRLRQPPKQLSKLVLGLQGLRLTILHLNVSKVDGVALYSFSVKVEEESKVSTVDEIAGGVYQLLGRIQEEAGSYF